MRKITIVDICNYIYPGEVSNGNITFGMNPGSKPWITKWDVLNTEQPSIEYLESRIPEYEKDFSIKQFQQNAVDFLRKFIEETAKTRNYDSSLSCLSYFNSSNEQWKKEAIAFSEWRDLLFNYIIDQSEKIEKGERPVPSLDDFPKELPPIVWP